MHFLKVYKYLKKHKKRKNLRISPKTKNAVISSPIYQQFQISSFLFFFFWRT